MGCGWLGLPLAKSLIEIGYRVHGSTTSKEKLSTLKEAGIQPFLIALSAQGITGDLDAFLQNLSVLVVNIPPKLRRGGGENYVQKIVQLRDAARKHRLQHILFISSTSVYGALEGEVTEETTPQPTTESGRQLLAAENLFFKAPGQQVTIVRFGGLIGPDRHPITMLSGKKGLTNGNVPVNLIHLNDCIGIVKAILQNSWWNELINGVHPHHPTKREYYTEEARKRNLQEPDYQEDTTQKGKKIVSKTLETVKMYEFTTSL